MIFPWLEYAKHQQDKIALRDYSQGVAFTWLELEREIFQRAKILSQQQIGLMSFVALKGKNNVDYLLFYLASLLLGARVLGINPAFSQEKITALCQANQIEVLVDCTTTRTECIKLCKEDKIGIPFLTLDHRFNLADSELNSLKSCFDKARTLTLTSGSTGLPKAVAHSITQHLDNAKSLCELMDFGAENAWLLSLPLYHISGQGIVWRWLSQGAELHLPSEDFYADALKATHLSLVPTQAQRLLAFLAEHQDKTAVKNKHILLGGSHISPELTEKLTALGWHCYVGYGMTEMASTVFAKKCDGKAGVGQVLASREWRLVNNEIWLRGAGLGCGYLEKGRLQSLTNAKGWLQTKDLAHWDGENLHIIGRVDNMFISGGENIQPEEIEQLLLQHSSVEQVFILPMDDVEFGQRPVAMVKLTTDFTETAVENLRLFLENKIERFKQPVKYFPLPTATQGQIKISRTELQQILLELLGK